MQKAAMFGLGVRKKVRGANSNPETLLQGLEWRRAREFFYWRVKCRLLLKDPSRVFALVYVPSRPSAGPEEVEHRIREADADLSSKDPRLSHIRVRCTLFVCLDSALGSSSVCVLSAGGSGASVHVAFRGSVSGAVLGSGVQVVNHVRAASIQW